MLYLAQGETLLPGSDYIKWRRCFMKKLLTLVLACVLLVCATAFAAAEAKITFQMDQEPQSMDPTLNDYSSGSYALQSLFRGLYKYAEDGELVPAMAQSYEVSEDGTVYTFKLKEGLKWSDGSPLTAYDFEYSWKRVCDPEVASDTAGTVYKIVKDGAACFVDGTVAVDDLPIKALDDTTLQVELVSPASYFLQLTASTAFMPVKKEVVEAYGNDWVADPATYVCNGPFMPSEFGLDGYTFVKNPNYYNADEVKIDVVRYEFIGASETAKMAFDSGEIDIATSVSNDAVAQYQGTPNLMATPRMGYRYYEFNCSNGIFADARVRRALTIALNREYVVRDGIHDSNFPLLNGWVPYTVKDVLDPSVDWRDAQGPAFEEDIEEAKALIAEALADAGLDAFPSFRISYVGDNTELVNAGMAMMLSWAQNLGIEATLDPVEYGVYWADDTGTRASGDYEIAYMGYTLDYAEPSAAFFLLENADGTAKNRWDCPEFRELCSQMRANISDEEREALYVQAEAMLAKECPVIPIYGYVATALVSDRVQGFTRNSNGHPNFEYCTIVE